MPQLLNDRRVLLPLLLTAIAIAVGSVGIVVLADDASSSASPSPSQPAASGAVRVVIADFKFKPVDVTVKVGGEVSWVNRDDAPHTATQAGGFDTGILQKGASKSETFAKAGSFAYICALHPFMKGTVVVR